MTVCTGIPGRPCPRSNARAVVRGMCRTCQYRDRRREETGCAAPAHEASQIDAAPFLSRLDREIASHNTIAASRDRKPVEKPGTLCDVIGVDWRSQEYKSLKNKIADIRKTGTMNVYFADEFCVKYFKEHPYFVFGQEWFDHSERTFEDELPVAA